MVLTLYHKCLHFFIYIWSKFKLFNFSKNENCILLSTKGVHSTYAPLHLYSN